MANKQVGKQLSFWPTKLDLVKLITGYWCLSSIAHLFTEGFVYMLGMGAKWICRLFVLALRTDIFLRFLIIPCNGIQNRITNGDYNDLT